ncbi:MAG: YfiM family protein [Cyclobacteriaceae bacterium]|nr:YfiM family protein [Cyclobacteriaceae bacterium]
MRKHPTDIEYLRSALKDESSKQQLRQVILNKVIKILGLINFKKATLLIGMIIIFFSCLPMTASSQNKLNAYSDSLNQKRLQWVYGGVGTTYAVGMVGLSSLWYAEQMSTEFNFFNDNADWLQMDKIGHAYSAYHLSAHSSNLLQWAGMDEDRAVNQAAIAGFLYLLPIEILDGFSRNYGFSWGDLAANASGSLLFWGQHQLWREQRIRFKYSFARSPYAAERPSLLGNGIHEEWLKDYNGQTYWLSLDLHAFLKDHFSFPKWLNIAVGYNISGMVSSDLASSRALGFQPARRFFLSPDLDLSYLRTNSKLLNTLIYLTNMVHFPAPALEWNSQRGLRAHPLYY